MEDVITGGVNDSLHSHMQPLLPYMESVKGEEQARKRIKTMPNLIKVLTVIHFANLKKVFVCSGISFKKEEWYVETNNFWIRSNGNKDYKRNKLCLGIVKEIVKRNSEVAILQTARM